MFWPIVENTFYHSNIALKNAVGGVECVEIFVFIEHALNFMLRSAIVEQRLGEGYEGHQGASRLPDVGSEGRDVASNS